MSDDVDRRIEAYRDRVQAEAALARRDLDEIEDHLRCLTDELVSRGLPAATAVAEACARMGDPRLVAREHARVRTHFGARLSRLRAWSAAALLIPLLWRYGGLDMLPGPLGIDAVAGFVLVAALIARRPWAHAVWLGYAAARFVPSAIWSASFPAENLEAAIWYGGVLAFLAPWRRGELTGAGLALSFQVWTYSIAALALGYQYTSTDGWTPVAPAAQVALVAALIAAAGGLVRARWGSIAAVVAAAAMSVALVQLWGLEFRFSHPDVFRVGLLGVVVAAVLGSGVSALFAWRAATSNLGARPA